MARATAVRAGLDPELFVLFHDLVSVTPETRDDVRDRWFSVIRPDSSMTLTDRRTISAVRGKIRRALDEISNSEPGDTDSLVATAMTELHFLLLFAVPMSDEQRWEVIEEVHNPFNRKEPVGKLPKR